jgi:dolichol kinase
MSRELFCLAAAQRGNSECVVHVTLTVFFFVSCFVASLVCQHAMIIAIVIVSLGDSLADITTDWAMLDSFDPVLSSIN